ncbi:DUF4011 domain-containing protein [Nesterenkonia lutea]|uniref:AAA family ATPase n=1 Tax=Nesterenkonia lutea TaxID=272919 RepID=A0ABR9JBZ0_9MICC|nr:DUF4011 domain-containing protein [Nesterenkonia lutea]MBE1523459.1 hypothetical protein [Nesterenkonia lutea]
MSKEPAAEELDLPSENEAAEPAVEQQRPDTSDDDAPASTAASTKSASSTESPVSSASASSGESADSAGSPASADSAGSPEEPGGTGAEGRDPVAAWLESVGSGTENDTMLRFAPSQHNAIDLTDANSSGMMQLMAGRKTRLSTLLNDPSAFNVGKQAAQGIRAKIREMSEERGIDVGFLAAGVASWTEDAGSGPSGERFTEDFTAPVMLVPITLRPREDGSGDFEIQFSAPARLNPALIRHLAARHRTHLDAEEFHNTGYVTARFDPNRPADMLARIAAEVPSLESVQVWRQLYVSTFADLTFLGDPTGLELDHPVIHAMASSTQLGQTRAVRTLMDLPPVDEREPRDERLVADADPYQQASLDAILAGQSAVVSAPAGTGQTQTAINAAAGLAWQGKRVLVLAERTATLEQFKERLSEVHLGTLAGNISAASTPEEIREQLIRAIRRAERAEPPRLTALHTRLKTSRHQLVNHVKSLHNVRRRWDCSPYQAMQALAALTSLNPAPSTAVRLKRSVLDNTVDRTQITVKLRRAAELGAFSAETRDSPWYNARLSNRQETRDAMTLVVQLRDELPQLSRMMRSACQAAGIAPGETFSDWNRQVLLFQRVQESLGKFSHDVYARPVDDLIAATAPGWWRRQNNVEMTSVTRSRLRRVAKEYVRPSVAIGDLHTSLIEVQSEREEWAEWSISGSAPKVPHRVDRLTDTFGEVQGRLQRLDEVLEAGPLADMPIEKLLDTVETLAGDEKPLETLPERTLLGEQLREQGFRDLMEDFAARGVSANVVADELELSWWQSALEAMISGDDYLAMTTGENLRSIESTFREADAGHIESSAQRLGHALSVRWKSAVEAHPQAAGSLRELLRDAAPTIESLEAINPKLTQPLVPIWTTSPLGLGEQFPADYRADAVILLDAESLAVPTALNAITRAGQVVAFGDPVAGSPTPFHVSADPVARETEQHRPASIYAELSAVLPLYPLRQVHRGVDQELTGLLSSALYDGELTRLPDAAQLTGQNRRFTVEQVAGVPAGYRDAVESPTGEVNRVVDMVFEHVRSRRSASLAVITGSEWHARRVADAIRLNLANHAWAKPFFAEGAHGEGFVVTPVERAAGLVRDDVIFSLGFGRSVKGEAATRFGELSEPRGREYFAIAVTRAREHLRVVTSLSSADMDRPALTEGARDVYDLVRLGLEGDTNPTASAQLTDPLVLDLVDRIRARGGRVEDGFRGTLDLAACSRKATPDTQMVPVAMVSDGTKSYGAMSVRERSRQRPTAFEHLGWSYMALWTIEVFSNPVRCTEAVAEQVGLASGPEFAESGRITVHTAGITPRGRRAREQEARGEGIRFGGAADIEDEDSHRKSKKWLSPRERGAWKE